VTDSWENKLGIEPEIEPERLLESALKAEPEPSALEDFLPETQNITFKREEVVELAKNELNFFAPLAMPTVFEYNFPVRLVAIWLFLLKFIDLPDKSFPQIALGIPRGFGKTTIIKLFILYLILFSKKRFIVVICDIESKAMNIVADVVSMLEEPNIQSLFGDWKMSAIVDQQGKKVFSFRGRVIILAALGAGGSIRGLNINNERPDAMIFDDIQTKECAESLVMSSALERWMVGTAMKAKSPRGCIFAFLGNMYPEETSILKKLKHNPRWYKFISGAILADGTSLWPELKPMEVLIEEFDSDIAMGHPEIFLSEVQNDTDVGINNRVDFSKFRAWNWQPHEKPQGGFILIDPAAGKQGGDAVAIGRVEVYDGIPGLREVIEQPLSPSNTIRMALLLALKNNIQVIAVEAQAYQYTLLHWFGVICEHLKIEGIMCVDVYSGSNSKNYRISEGIKALQAGEIVLHPDVAHIVTSQISNWNPLKRVNRDNILDVITYIPKTIELYGPMIALREQQLVLETQASGVIQNNHAF
jgi:hypothetical protein